MRFMITAAIIALAVLPLPAWAQQRAIETRPPGPPEVVAPGLHYEQTRPSDADYYPLEGTRVEHDPAFIEPFTRPTPTGRAGPSGWVSPTTPVGFQNEREVPGYLAFGFSVTWGGPPTGTKRAVR
jgi:hypothetical protein